MNIQFYLDANNSWLFVDKNGHQRIYPSGSSRILINGTKITVKALQERKPYINNIEVTNIQKSATPNDNYTSVEDFKAVTADFFKAPTGSGGGSYGYQAFATNAAGANWTLTYAEGVTLYFANISSPVALDPPTEADFAGAQWINVGGGGAGLVIDQNITEGSNNAARSGAVYDELQLATKRNSYVAGGLALISIGGKSLHFSEIIQKININFPDNYSIKKDDGNIREIYAPTINYLSATQVYVSWRFQNKDGSFGLYTGSNYYVNIGSDTSSIPFSYTLPTPDGNVDFSGYFDFSNLNEGDIASSLTQTSTLLDVNVLINGAFSLTLTDIAANKVSNGYQFQQNNQKIIEQNRQLFDKTNTGIQPGYLDENDNIVGHATAKVSYYIPIVPNTPITCKGHYGFVTKIWVYDYGQNPIRYIDTPNDATDEITFTPNDGELYVRYSIRDIEVFMVEFGTAYTTYQNYKYTIKPEIFSNYSDIDVVVFGDSITKLPDNWTTEFSAQVKPKSLLNLALEGQKIAWRAGTVETPNPTTGANDNNVLWNSIQNLLVNYPAVIPNVVIIAEGTNDISQSSPLGSYTDAFAQDEPSTSQLTMANAYRKAVQLLMTTFPNVQIFYATPIQSKTGGRNYDNLTNVADINTEISNRLNVNIIDALHLSGIVDEYEEVGAAGRYLYDGTHPSAAGAKIHGRCMANEFKRSYQKYSDD